MDVMGLTSMQDSGNAEDSTRQVNSIRAAFSVSLLIMPPVSRQSETVMVKAGRTSRFAENHHAKLKVFSFAQPQRRNPVVLPEVAPPPFRCRRFR
jgi:hypothetical protein